jgi:hypothetical protein
MVNVVMDVFADDSSFVDHNALQLSVFLKRNEIGAVAIYM